MAKYFGEKEGFTKLCAWRGDVMTTWFDKESRNRTFGENIILGLNQGENVEQILSEEENKGDKKTTIEGYYAAKAIYDIAKEKSDKYPIICGVYNTLFMNSSPENEINKLIALASSNFKRVTDVFQNHRK